MIPTPDRELVLRWMESSGGFDVVDIVQQVATKAAAWGWMQAEPGKTVKISDRPNHLRIGDVWEFETEVKEKGKMKPKTMQWRVVQWHHGEMAWQLQSLDGKYFEYLLTHAPQYENMKFIGAGEMQ